MIKFNCCTPIRRRSGTRITIGDMFLLVLAPHQQTALRLFSNRRSGCVHLERRSWLRLGLARSPVGFGSQRFCFSFQILEVVAYFSAVVGIAIPAPAVVATALPSKASAARPPPFEPEASSNSAISVGPLPLFLDNAALHSIRRPLRDAQHTRPVLERVQRRLT